jgi:hypothetical protein
MVADHMLTADCDKALKEMRQIGEGLMKIW